MGVTNIFVTYSQKKHRDGYDPGSREAPTCRFVDCRDLPCPPRDMCRDYTGLNRRVREEVFSHREARRLYKKTLDRIEESVERNHERSHPKSYLTVAVSCAAGVHRSVSMAMRLANEVEGWKYVRAVELEHIDLDEAVERRDNNRWCLLCDGAASLWDACNETDSDDGIQDRDLQYLLRELLLSNGMLELALLLLPSMFENPRARR